MNDRKNNYTVDNESNDIEEYLERDLKSRNYSKGASQKKRGESRKNNNRKTDKKKPFILQYYNSNKLKALWSVLGALVVILISALIVTNVKGSHEKDDTDKAANESETDEKESEETETTTAEAEEETSGSESAFLAEPVDSVYNQILGIFLSNSYVQWNEEELAKVCDSIQNLNKDNFVYLNKYVEEIQDLHCYVGYVYEDGRELIYATYNIKFHSIETALPSMEAYVMAKSEDSYKICNFKVSDEMDVYTNSVKENQNYLDLVSGINTQLSEALDNDEDLKKIYDALNGLGTEE